MFHPTRIYIVLDLVCMPPVKRKYRRFTITVLQVDLTTTKQRVGCSTCNSNVVYLLADWVDRNQIQFSQTRSTTQDLEYSVSRVLTDDLSTSRYKRTTLLSCFRGKMSHLYVTRPGFCRAVISSAEESRLLLSNGFGILTRAISDCSRRCLV